jgi:DNA-binding NarL/FixJ family response regulator
MSKIIIVDDHPLVREGFKKLIGESWGMEVVGECSTASEALETISQVECDVVVLDIGLPDKSGLEALKDIRIRKPEVRVLMLSIHPEERYAIRALRAGACGYLTKKSAAEDLIKAIQRIERGGRYVSEELADRLAYELSQDKSEVLHEKLSDREFEVLRLIGSGSTSQDIAKTLSISLSTVNTYRKRILSKMDMTSNQQLMRYAITNQLID